MTVAFSEESVRSPERLIYEKFLEWEDKLRQTHGLEGATEPEQISAV